MTTSLTQAEFNKEVLETKEVVLIDFWAPWCGPCQALGPVIDELAEEAPSGAKVYKVNVDEEVDLAAKFGVMSIPAIKVFKDGEVVDETVGIHSKDELKAMLERHQ